MGKANNLLILCLAALPFIAISTLTGCRKKQDHASFSVANGTTSKISLVTIKLGSNPKYDLGSILPGDDFSFDGPLLLNEQNTIYITWTVAAGEQESHSFQVAADELKDVRRVRFKINANGTPSKQWQFP